jgi:hypothetical protein
MDSTANPGAVRLHLPRTRSRSSAAEFLSMHRYLPIAAFYFFFNCAGLPIGYFYTSLLSPLLFLLLFLKGKRWLTTRFLLVLSPFMLAQAILGVADRLDYARTLLHWWTVYVAAYAVCWALTKCRNLDRLFDQLTLLNFCAAMVAVAIRFTPLRLLLWMDTGETIVGTPHLLRLNLFNTEPSAYAELMLPLVVFAALRLLRDSKMRSAAYLAMIAVPFLLCQSFGGISIGLAGIGTAVLAGYRNLLSRPRSRILFFGLAIVTSVLLLVPSPISQRIFQVLGGGDGSAKGRTILAYIAAVTVASSKSLWWGVGLGQAKYVDFSSLGFGLAGHIPNVAAGILAEFGVAGVLVMLAVEVRLFFKTKVTRNSFRLAMFTVAFVGQFTGSYGTDIQQYVMWFLAFYPFFPEFDRHPASRPEARAR